LKIIGVIDTITKIKMIPGVARTLESNTKNKVDADMSCGDYEENMSYQ
jgi:hypothetical protein